ncbi:MAG: CCA tRNA nucleotidyltransferase [Candidatus Bathyarchaeota archaeon]|nr:CCA tRNA nucleotidyltransferase [Candidatus Termiticorpusculum sp.]
MQIELETLTQQVLKKISPTPEEYCKVEVLSKQLKQKLLDACKQQNVKATVRVEGSIAKDTWLKENPDIDIFIRLPTTISREKLGEIGLKIARSVTQNATHVTERFAEHPYLEITINEMRVDIVPCFNAAIGEWQSATDRTPYHTNYIRQHLTPKMREETRLLKQFMKCINVYGAEIKIGGFSGYLCELLILTFGSFVQTVQAFANYNKRLVIDPQRHFADKEKDVVTLFSEPLVIVDPVDKARNVASAVQAEKLYSFIGASRAFLQNPSEIFFFAPKQSALDTDDLKCMMNNHGSSLLFLVTGGIDAVPDVFWGQFYKSRRSLRKLLEFNGFKVFRDAVWSNEKSFNVFIFKLEQLIIADVKKHFGPPLECSDECAHFLAKYTKNSQTVAGPYIEDGKWVVEITRKNVNALSFLREKLVDGGKNVGVSELFAKAFNEGFTVFDSNGIIQIYSEYRDFACFLSRFLLGKTDWLK